MLEGTTPIDTPKHSFKNFKEARSWAKENVVGTYKNADTGENIAVSGVAVEKYLSDKAVSKSVSLDAHLSALKVLPKLIEISILKEKHPDKNENSNVKEIQRLFGAIHYEKVVYPVKLTVKVTYIEARKAYSYEVMKIENPTGTLGDRIP